MSDLKKETAERISTERLDVEGYRNDRGPVWCAIFDTLRDYRLSNMTFEGTDEPFCLVDLVSTIGGDISTGEAELLLLADEISLAHDALASRNAHAQEGGEVEPDAYKVTDKLARYMSKTSLVLSDDAIVPSLKLDTERFDLTPLYAAPVQPVVSDEMIHAAMVKADDLDFHLDDIDARELIAAGRAALSTKTEGGE